jgi:Reverse transcriptase (RNA-dependent DNA polymerase)/RNase H-like domain found in reverse transcriptase
VYQYKVMPFGLCNAPSVFKRFVNNILQNIYPENVFVYLDDILIATNTLNENKHITHTLIKQLLANNLFGKSTKCQFTKSQIIFLGFQISAIIINPTENHLNHILNFETPKNIKQLQTINGLCNFLRSFIPNFTLMTNKLTSQTTQKRPIWNNSLNKKFLKIKAALNKPETLHQPNYDLLLKINTDASNIAISSYIYQEVDNTENNKNTLDDVRKKEKTKMIISYFSRTLAKSEKNYSTIEQELLAIVFI